MTRKEALDLIKLLSALESWSFSTGQRLPEYLHGQLAEAVEILTQEVLEARDVPLASLPFTAYALKVLASAGCTHASHIRGQIEADLLRLPNVGARTVKEIRTLRDAGVPI